MYEDILKNISNRLSSILKTPILSNEISLTKALDEVERLLGNRVKPVKSFTPKSLMILHYLINKSCTIYLDDITKYTNSMFHTNTNNNTNLITLNKLIKFGYVNNARIRQGRSYKNIYTITDFGRYAYLEMKNSIGKYLNKYLSPLETEKLMAIRDNPGLSISELNRRFYVSATNNCLYERNYVEIKLSGKKKLYYITQKGLDVITNGEIKLN